MRNPFQCSRNKCSKIKRNKFDIINMSKKKKKCIIIHYIRQKKDALNREHTSTTISDVILVPCFNENRIAIINSYVTDLEFYITAMR